MRNILFAEDSKLVKRTSPLRVVERVPVKRLTFVPDSRVWSLIR
jgi:hypothetical protein